MAARRGLRTGVEDLWRKRVKDRDGNLVESPSARDGRGLRWRARYVDDAGAGYASFSLIASLKPTIIKIDRDIVHGIGHDDAKQALVEAFVSFGRRIGAHLLAEGDRVTWASSIVCGECYYCRLKHQPTRCVGRRAYGISYCADEAPHLRGGRRVLRAARCGGPRPQRRIGPPGARPTRPVGVGAVDSARQVTRIV